MPKFRWPFRKGEGSIQSHPGTFMDPVKEAELDQKLNSVSQQFVAQAIKRSPDEELSMAWRSELNSKLASVASDASKKQRRSAWIWRPTVGLVGACALAAVIWLPRSVSSDSAVPNASYTLEQEIASAHVAAENSTMLVGAPVVLADAPLGSTEEYEFVPIDLETL